MENSSFLSASKRISAPIFLCFCGACSLCFFSCPKCPISALCSVLSKQLRQQNNQCAYFICLCVFVRACLVSQNVVEQNHWASHSLEHQSNQHIPLFLSLSHTHTHTHPLRHFPFTLIFSLYIFSTRPRSKLACFVLVFSVHGFQMQICLLLFVLLVRFSLGYEGDRREMLKGKDKASAKL